VVRQTELLLGSISNFLEILEREHYLRDFVIPKASHLKPLTPFDILKANVSIRLCPDNMATNFSYFVVSIYK
jgi:hypothetical protein